MQKLLVGQRNVAPTQELLIGVDGTRQRIDV